jgi:uncharacterized membrane protein YedE/YeeE
MRNFFSLFSGILFGLGLAISGMVNPDKVIGFLDVAGKWDPSLALVMGGALLITAFSFHWILKRPAPIFSDLFHLPTKKDLDSRLINGAAIFGIGWGLAGLCPGPALASIGYLDKNLLIFVLALVVGSSLANGLFLRVTVSPRSTSEDDK